MFRMVLRGVLGLVLAAILLGLWNWREHCSTRWSAALEETPSRLALTAAGGR